MSGPRSRKKPQKPAPVPTTSAPAAESRRALVTPEARAKEVSSLMALAEKVQAARTSLRNAECELLGAAGFALGFTLEMRWQDDSPLPFHEVGSTDWAMAFSKGGKS